MKLRHINTMEYYSAIKKNEIDTQRELEAIILSEMSQSQKENFPMFSLICA